MNPFKKNDASLSKKLKGALTDLTVDIFGYEKMVTKTITNRTNYISNRLQIPKDRLYIRIFQKDHIIRSFLYNQSKPVSAIPTQELTYFFMEEHNWITYRIKLPSASNNTSKSLQKPIVLMKKASVFGFTSRTIKSRLELFKMKSLSNKSHLIH